METPPLVVSGLHKSYGDFPVLNGLDLEIAPNSVMGLVGLNGSGKTTTIECLLGLQGFNGGSIRLLDHAPGQLHRLQGDVVAIFDHPSLHSNLTVAQCLHHAALLCPDPVRSVAEVEDLLSIDRFHDFRIRQLSLGNKRRTSIAQALLGNPKFIILDEPFNGLDAEGVDDVLELIAQLNREFGTSFLLSSHQLPYLEQVCSHVAILSEGVIVRSGSIAELLDSAIASARLSSSEPDRAESVLGGIDDISVLSQEGERLEIDLGATDSAALIQQLVTAGVPVSEFTLQRASLAGLFRELTGSEA